MTLTDRTTRIPAHGTRDLDEKKRENNDDVLDVGDTGSLPPTYDHTHRKLKARHIQLIGTYLARGPEAQLAGWRLIQSVGIGGTIGTALYVQIGKALIKGGPGSLLIAFTLWYVGQCRVCVIWGACDAGACDPDPTGGANC